MPILEALYQQDPFWVWLCLASFFVAMNLATGSSLLMWPGVAAAVVATLEVLGLRLGLQLEAGLFLVILTVAIAVAILRAPRTVVVAGESQPQRTRGPRAAAGRQEQTGKLVGRIARSSGEFVNGVGRVWIDGAEWGAELDGAGETLPDGQPVRITKVIGGIKLQVHPLQTD